MNVPLQIIAAPLFSLPSESSTIDTQTPVRLANTRYNPPDYLGFPPSSDLGLNYDLLGDSQMSHPAMQSSKDAQDLNEFSLEAIRTLFEPTGGPISSPESSRLIPYEHSNSRIHGNMPTEPGSAPPFMSHFEGPHLLRSTTRHSVPARLPNMHSRSLSGGSNCSQSYEGYPRLSPQSRKRANSEDEDHSDDLEPLDPNATDGQKKEYKRRQNTLAARRSRAKRALEAQSLRDENARLKTENAVWKERAMMMERLLATHGVPCPSFSS